MNPPVPDEYGELRELAGARRQLLDSGADELPRMPWQPPGVGPDDVTLLRFAMRQANASVGEASHQDLRAALSLIRTARADLDALEAGLILIARAEGLTWPEVARHLGVRSPQAAQQRFQRVSSRTRDDGPEGEE